MWLVAASTLVFRFFTRTSLSDGTRRARPCPRIRAPGNGTPRGGSTDASPHPTAAANVCQPFPCDTPITPNALSLLPFALPPELREGNDELGVCHHSHLRGALAVGVAIERLGELEARVGPVLRTGH